MATYNIPEGAREAFISFEAGFLKSYLSKPDDMWLTDDLIQIVRAGPDMTTARFGVPIIKAGYREHQGEIKYRELSRVFLDVTYREWSDGVHEKLDTLMAVGQWTGWQEQQMAMAQEAWRLEQKVVAAAVEANAVGWDGVTFFNAAHPIDFYNAVDGTQSNILTSMTPSVTNIGRAQEAFRRMKGPDGQYLGLRLQGFLSPVDLTQPLDNLLKPLTGGVVMQVANGDSDPYQYRGKFWLREVPEFTDQTVYYAVATNTGQKPFLGMRKLAPAAINMQTGQVTVGADDVETFIHDKNSHHYENDGMVGIGKKKKFGARLGLHTAIIRCEV